MFVFLSYQGFYWDKCWNCVSSPFLDGGENLDVLIGLFCCQTLSHIFPAAAAAAGCVARGVFSQRGGGFEEDF